MSQCRIQNLVVVVVGAWGAEEQEAAEVKYHSCFMLTFHPVPPASGDLVIYGATGAEQIKIHLPHGCRLTRLYQIPACKQQIVSGFELESMNESLQTS